LIALVRKWLRFDYEPFSRAVWHRSCGTTRIDCHDSVLNGDCAASLFRLRLFAKHVPERAGSPGFHSAVQTYWCASRSMRGCSPPQFRQPTPPYSLSCPYKRRKISSAAPRQVTRTRRTGEVSTPSLSDKITPVFTSRNCPFPAAAAPAIPALPSDGSVACGLAYPTTLVWIRSFLLCQSHGGALCSSTLAGCIACTMAKYGRGLRLCRSSHSNAGPHV
jgi:hypothetical protein